MNIQSSMRKGSKKAATSLIPTQRTDFGLSERNPIVFRRFSLSASTDVQVHMHYPVELGYVFAGTMERIHVDGKLTIRQGDIWMNGLWEPHAWQVASPEIDIAVFHILPECLATLSFPEMPGTQWLAPFLAPPLKRPRLPPSAHEGFRRLFENACALPDNKGYPLRVRLSLIEILLSLLDYWKPPTKAASDLEPFDRINRAVEILFDTRTFVSAQEMALQCGMSRARFNNLFEEHMGLSFPEFGLRYRLSRTAHELTDTQMPIKAIARKWGFADASHFYRHFKKFYHCTPHQYRMQPKASSISPGGLDCK